MGLSAEPDRADAALAARALAEAETAELVLAITDEQIQITYIGAAWDDLIGLRRADGTVDWRLALHPDDLPQIEAALTEAGVPEPGRAPLQLEARIVHPNRGVRWVSSRLVPRFRDDGTFAGYLVVGSDITELREANARIERMAAEQDALRRLATSVAAQGTLAEVGDLAAQLIVELMPDTVASVARFDGDAAVAIGTSEVERIVPGGFPDRFPLDGDSSLGRVCRTGEFARIDDHDVSQSDDQSRQSARTHGITSAMAAPVVVAGEVWGAVHVGRADGIAFSAHQESQLVRLAELVGLAVAGAKARDELHALAMTDPLTGVANRRALLDRMEVVLAALPPDDPATLALVDVDGLKRINDRFGHERGDHAIVDVAEVLQAHAAAGDLVARLGGDEFAWLQPHADLVAAETAVEQARRRLRMPLDIGARVSISVGICQASPGMSARQWLQWADAALYGAKASGGGTTRVAVGT